MKTFRKIISIFTVLVGVAVIYFGSTLLETTDSHTVGTADTSISPGYHPVDYASFGADFYTYIYKAAYSVAKGMNDVQKGIESSIEVQNNVRREVAGNTRAVDELIRTTARVGGYVVMAIGLWILVYGLQCTANAFIVNHVVIDNLPAPVYRDPMQPVCQKPERAEETNPAEEMAAVPAEAED